MLGISPDSLLLLTVRVLSSLRLPNVLGIIPDSLLSLRLRVLSSPRLPNCGSIFPDRRLYERFRCFKLTKLPRPGGIPPVTGSGKGSALPAYHQKYSQSSVGTPSVRLDT